jgi:hypothetical protein
MSNTFSKYLGTPYQPYIRPVIPPGATLAPNSRIEPEKRGKVPGLWSGQDWIGIPGFLHDKAASSSSLTGWDTWLTENVALRTGEMFNGVDIDTEHAAMAEALRAAAERILAPAPVRGRSDSVRCLLAYRRAEGAEPLRRRTLAWRMPGEDPGASPGHQLELLGAGGHMMIEGVHPSGSRYEYRDGRDLLTWGANNLAAIDEAAIETFFAEAEALIATSGGMIARRSVGGPASAPGGRRVIGDPAHLAPSTESAIRALRAIPCNELDYDDWIRVTAAFKAATGGADDAHDAYIEWSLGYADNSDAAAEGKWNSINDAELGARWLFAKAAEWGFNEAIALFDPFTDEEGRLGRTAANANMGPGDTSSDEKTLFERWEDRFAYVEPVKEFVDLRSLTLQRYDLQAFKLKFPMFTPWSVNANAVIRYLQSDRKTVCDGYTYRPGQPRIVREEGRRLINRWSPGLAVLDRVVTMEDPPVARPPGIPDPQPARARDGAQLAGCIEPTPQPQGQLRAVDRRQAGNWQKPAVRPDHPSVGPTQCAHDLRGRDQGQVHRLGRRKGAGDAGGDPRSSRRGAQRAEDVYRRTALFCAVNEKHMKPYEVPNVAKFVAFTNSEYALQLADDDRRWFVIWSPVLAKPPAYYTDLARWMAENAALIGTWLTQRDLSGFNAQERAPMTTAKREMQLVGRNALDYWVYEAIANGQAPFETDLVSVDDVLARLPYEARHLRPSPTEKSLTMALKSAGAAKLDRVSLGRVLETTGTNRTVLWAIRRQAMLCDLRHAKLVELFWRQRDERVPRLPRFTNLDEPEAKAG